MESLHTIESDSPMTTPRRRSSMHQGHFPSDVSASTPPPHLPRNLMSRDTVNSEVFTAVYSGVAVLEMTCRGVSVMRRRSDSALNATQILKVAGIQKGNRTKILEREILPGPHEKVQGGYGKYQGTWISYDIGVSLCERHGVRDILAPLLELDTASAPAMHATPTKEQHQASIRRHQLNSGRHDGMSNLKTSDLLEGSKMASRGSSAAVLAALHTNRPHGNLSAAHPSDACNDHANDQSHDSLHFPNPVIASRDWTEPQKTANGHLGRVNSIVGDHRSLPPITAETAREFDRSREFMTNIFLESDHGRVPDILHENTPDSGLDIDVPIDELGHTALHWAAALARQSLVEALIARGAKPERGNSTGETALMRAVMATNTMDSNSFLELLGVLGASLAKRDTAQRSVLHHIALTAGIKGRSAASRYYLTSLLEWIVKNDRRPGMDIATFSATLVNVRDRNGDTALNIAARIGNRGIVQHLLEVGADPYLPNKAGIRPIDSGTVEDHRYQDTRHVDINPSVQKVVWNNAAVNKASSEISQELTDLIASLQHDFELEMAEKCKAVESVNRQLREASKTLADLRRQVEFSKHQMAKLDEISQRIRNTRNAIVSETGNYNEAQMGRAPPQFGESDNADAAFQVTSTDKPPSPHLLKARIKAYKENINTLDILAVTLNDKSSAMEARCRKLVSLCTNSPLSEVDETLGALLAALQSDGDPRDFDLNEANRVAGFLKILS